jgi:hypothetical protein
VVRLALERLAAEERAGLDVHAALVELAWAELRTHPGRAVRGMPRLA